MVRALYLGTDSVAPTTQDQNLKGCYDDDSFWAVRTPEAGQLVRELYAPV